MLLIRTFKDVAAALAASVMKENGIKEYCVASTGNTATAFSKYLAKAGIRLSVFVPNCVCEDTVKEIRSYGQNLVISEGDYGAAKAEAADYHKNNHVLISGGKSSKIIAVGAILEYSEAAAARRRRQREQYVLPEPQGRKPSPDL